MSQMARLVDLLAQDPEIQALIDQFQGQSFPQPNASGGFPTNPNFIDPKLFESQPGTLGGPTASTIAEKTDLLSRGIGTDRFGVEFARGLEPNPKNLGPRPSAPRPLGETPSPIDPKFTLAARKQFMDERREEATQQGLAREEAKFANQQQVDENRANVRSGLEDIIEQLSQSFGSRDRIPPIGSSFIGAEPLEGAIPGSQPIYGVTAGPFTLGKFTSQEAADQARDVLRRELKQGPAPPPSFLLADAGSVIAPFGRAGAEQVDDIRSDRALGLSTRRVALDERAEERRFQQLLGRGAGGGGGGRAGGRAGGGGGVRPFQVVQRAMKLPAVGGVPAGFVMVESVQNLRLPSIEGREGATPAGQRTIDILSGRSGITSMRQAKRLAGDSTEIRDLLDRGALDPDEAIAAEIMRARLENAKDPVGSKGRAQRVRGILQSLGDAVMTRQEASSARAALGIAPGESELIGIADAQEAALFEARQRASRGTEAETRTKDAATRSVNTATREATRFKERVTPTERAEERELRSRETRELALGRRGSQILDTQERARISQLRLRLQPLDREISRLFASIKKEEAKEFDLFKERSFPGSGGGPDAAEIARLNQKLAQKQAERDQLVSLAIPGFDDDPLSEAIRGQLQ